MGVAPELARHRLVGQTSSNGSLDVLVRDLDRSVTEGAPTPRRVFLPALADTHISEVCGAIERAGRSRVAVTAAFSVKTNPSRPLLETLRQHGLRVEAISQLEVQLALACGFTAEDIVLNGPAKWWPERIDPGAYKAVFCDSLEELRRVVRWLHRGELRASVVGVRLRIPESTSRFGVRSASEDLDALVRLLRRVPEGVRLGLHFHVSTLAVTTAGWWECYALFLERAALIRRALDRAVDCLDVGGGWSPDDFVSTFLPGLPVATVEASRALPELVEVLVEPGRALAQPAMAVLTRVLEVRRQPRRREVVVDGSVSDLPDIAHHPHRWLSRCATDHDWRSVGHGHDLVLGRTCMESDLLAPGLSLPDGLREGDVLAVCDAGAYDTSKSFSFGRAEAGATESADQSSPVTHRARPI